jgi:glutathione synthase
MDVAFQMEPMELTKNGETHTLLLMEEAEMRGFRVWHFTPSEVSVHYEQGKERIVATARRVFVEDGANPHFTYGEEKTIDLCAMRVIFIRQDPPFDMEYITSTYFLERVAKYGKTLVVNNPASIRDFPEKIFPFYFQKFMPPTLITRNQKELDAFRVQHGDVVMKPLYGFHGHGVSIVHAWEDFCLPSVMPEPMIFQKFLPEVRQGNKRIVLIDGKIDNAIITVPPEGEFRVYRDSVDYGYTMNARDISCCEAIGGAAKHYGLLFVGVDMIGDYLTEINVTSVGSIRRLNAIYGGKCEARIWDAVLQKLA